MAKVYVFNTLDLHPGVKGEDFERFWLELEEYGILSQRLGWPYHLVKGDRGERVGQYAEIWEIPSVESRDRVVPVDGQLSEEGLRLLGPEFQILYDKLDTFATSSPFTEYVELGA